MLQCNNIIAETEYFIQNRGLFLDSCGDRVHTGLASGKGLLLIGKSMAWMMEQREVDGDLLSSFYQKLTPEITNYSHNKDIDPLT